MVKIVTSDIKTLRDSFDTISQIIDEASVRFRKNGIELTAADRAMVAVVDFSMSKNAFETYECDTEMSIGLNLLNFLSILKRAGNNDKLTLEPTEGKLNILFEGSSRRSFAVPLIELSKDEIPAIGQFDFPASFVIDAGVLIQGTEDADIFADSLIFEVSGTGMKLSAEGDNNKSELILEKNNQALQELNVKDSVKSRYPLDYLKKMLKASKLVGIAKIFLGNDYPMKIEFAGDNVKMGFVLAPRVQED